MAKATYKYIKKICANAGLQLTIGVYILNKLHIVFWTHGTNINQKNGAQVKGEEKNGVELYSFS